MCVSQNPTLQAEQCCILNYFYLIFQRGQVFQVDEVQAQVKPELFKLIDLLKDSSRILLHRSIKKDSASSRR